MIDIDHFKKINDTFGHVAGDEVLCTLARRVELHVRSFDTVARYGGEEFIVVMPDTELAVAQSVAERLRIDLGKAACNVQGVHEEIAVTNSVGVASTNVGDFSGVGLLERVDKALYEAKSRGRDCVVASTDEGLATVDKVVPLRAVIDS